MINTETIKAKKLNILKPNNFKINISGASDSSLIIVFKANTDNTSAVAPQAGGKQLELHVQGKSFVYPIKIYKKL